MKCLTSGQSTRRELFPQFLRHLKQKNKNSERALLILFNFEAFVFTRWAQLGATVHIATVLYYFSIVNIVNSIVKGIVNYIVKIKEVFTVTNFSFFCFFGQCCARIERDQFHQ
jgi:hypothetical protein